MIALFLSGTLLLWNHKSNNLADIWIYRFVILIGGLALPFSVYLGEKVSVLFGVFFCYLFFQGLLFSSLPYIAAPSIDSILSHLPTDVAHAKGIFQALHLSAALNLVIVCLVPIFLLARTKAHQPYFKCIWYSPFVVAALFLSFGVFFARRPHYSVPYMQNPSITGTFLAIILVGTDFWWVALPLGIALLVMGSTTPMFCVFIGLFVRFIYLSPASFLKKLPVFAGIGALSIYGTIVALPKIADNGSGRFLIWSQVLDWFSSQPLMTRIFGVGMGSTPILVPLLQLTKGANIQDTGFAMYMHSDWLQILYEFGVVGFSLGALFFIQAIYKSRGDRKWCAMLASFGAAMCTNFPMHSAIISLLGIVLVGGAYFE